MAFDYDAELRHLDPPFRAALGIGRADRVLDVGCGSGRTTRDAARTAADGHVLGVDVSKARIDEARELAAAEGLRNVAFDVADAQTRPFPAAAFDLVMSRFGTMFFTDPAAAFGNLARATKPGGRLVMMVWRERAANEWAGPLIDAVLGGAERPPADDSAFSLAGRESTHALLRAAGFGDVEFSEVSRRVWYGADVDAALEAVLQLRDPQQALARFTGADLVRARGRLRAELAARATPDGVQFDARAWIVVATR
ncbi:class I SAM-dependent methyltransferase [Jiangella rhizosphaerae]|uniref:Methyltransferase domain-containing protein n=1 Tax=Jiangella rhizosphaerae TaxID=2293569 RepID=A0A418KT88_9ACTN|nr:methyltransferase domain-containing protein [Jiangella rhizosphaerae]RIQ29638.1 methyltransferase domain-containing protein [Jiangella rhizosphaerae]